MAEFRHVNRIMVSLWGQRVGMIVSNGSREESYAFQYDRKFPCRSRWWTGRRSA